MLFQMGVPRLFPLPPPPPLHSPTLPGHPVRNEFYKDTQGALLVFDCTSRRSFESLDAWHKEATGFGAQYVSFALCGN